MGEREEHKPPKIDVKGKNLELSVGELSLDDIKRHPTVHVSPRGSSGNNNSMTKLQQPSSARWNCLCSPTTHAGSFRCRHHRSSGGMTRGGSVGSNLSLLASTKSHDFFESPLR